jgi:hypothetical protein
MLSFSIFQWSVDDRPPGGLAGDHLVGTTHSHSKNHLFLLFDPKKNTRGHAAGLECGVCSQFLDDTTPSPQLRHVHRHDHGEDGGALGPHDLLFLPAGMMVVKPEN